MLVASLPIVQSVPPLFTGWTSGPEADARGPLLISVTDFAADRARDVPRITRTGLQLRRGWYGMQGAVALALWSLPLSTRSGSVSVWLSEADLQRFVALPAHVAVMRRYRQLGHLRATTWEADSFVAADILRRARQWVAERT